MAYNYTHAIIEDATSDVKAMGIPGTSMRAAGAGETQYACDFDAYTGGPPKFTAGSPNTITNDTVQADTDARKAFRDRSLFRAAGANFAATLPVIDACTLLPQLMALTTNADATEMTRDRAAVSASNRLEIPDDCVWSFHYELLAQRQDADEIGFYEIKGVIKRISGTTTLVWSTVITHHEDTAAWVVAVTADDTNNSLVITVTGAATSTIWWLAGPPGTLQIG